MPSDSFFERGELVEFPYILQSQLEPSIPVHMLQFLLVITGPISLILLIVQTYLSSIPSSELYSVSSSVSSSTIPGALSLAVRNWDCKLSQISAVNPTLWSTCS